METAIELARTHLAEARRSVGALRPTRRIGRGRRDRDQAARRSRAAHERRADRRRSSRNCRRAGDGVEREIVSIAQEALTNALRHADARRITIRASTVRSIGLRVSVADDGRGIARDRSGSGFGMTSMQERADKIGASLTIVTAPRSGTEVVLAWEPSVAADAGAHRCLRRPSRRARAAVLLVDDHALLRTGVANIINQEPDLHVVAEAGNGVEAIDAFERHQPDVTLLDLRMPVMEGVEAIRRIRDRDPRARVIVLTTYDTDEEISRALKAGAKAYVLKDISADELVKLHPRRPRREDLPGARGRSETGGRGDARATHAARTGQPAPDGRRQVQQGNRQRAGHQRADGEDPPRTSVRETRRHQPDRGDQDRDAARARPARLGTRGSASGSEPRERLARGASARPAGALAEAGTRGAKLRIRVARSLRSRDEHDRAVYFDRMIPISDVIPSRTVPVVTVGLIVVNVLVFLYELTLSEPLLQQFVGTYALIPAWFSIPALFTSQFLHGGWLHIISNMLYLWIFGDNVEDRLGHGWFIVFYLGAGAVAAILQLLFDPFSSIPIVGASGAIAGVMGAYFVLYPYRAC